MKIWIAAAVAAIGLAAAPQASADDDDYLRLLEDSYVLNEYGSEVLLREGHKVCDSIQQGMTDAEVVSMVLSDLPKF